jgi:hypothetical protein
MTSRLTAAIFGVVGLAIVGLGPSMLLPQEPLPGVHEVTITARRCSFSPSRIEVNAHDIVKITFVAEKRLMVIGA